MSDGAREESGPDRGPVAQTRHGELSLDQIGGMQMGMARLMREYSDRIWSCYYAARDGNWPLAIYMLNNTLKLHGYGGETRPKMKPYLDRFEAERLRPLMNTAVAEDWAAFETAFQAAVDGGNALHVELGYPYIQWTLPPDPPPHLRTTPTDSA